MESEIDRETAVLKLVRLFYERGLEDDILAPIFKGAIHDWEGHFQIVADFWSHVLYGTTRYKGRPFPAHMHLPMGPEAFDRWLILFQQTADDVLPPLQAQLAMAKANHMSQSFKAGLFPFIHPDGSISRHPYKA